MFGKIDPVHADAGRFLFVFCMIDKITFREHSHSHSGAIFQLGSDRVFARRYSPQQPLSFFTRKFRCPRAAMTTNCVPPLAAILCPVFQHVRTLAAGRDT